MYMKNFVRTRNKKWRSANSHRENKKFRTTPLSLHSFKLVSKIHFKLMIIILLSSPKPALGHRWLLKLFPIGGPFSQTAQKSFLGRFCWLEWIWILTWLCQSQTTSFWYDLFLCSHIAEVVSWALKEQIILSERHWTKRMIKINCIFFTFGHFFFAQHVNWHLPSEKWNIFRWLWLKSCLIIERHSVSENRKRSSSFMNMFKFSAVLNSMI